MMLNEDPNVLELKETQEVGDSLFAPQTCYIKLDFQRDLIGQCSVSEKLIGFLERSVFCGDSVD